MEIYRTRHEDTVKNNTEEKINCKKEKELFFFYLGFILGYLKGSINFLFEWIFGNSS